MSELSDKLRKEAEIAPHEVYNWLNPLLIEAADALDAADSRAPRLVEAVTALYYAAHWYPDREVDAAALWTEIRDAAGLERGKTAELLGPPRGPLKLESECCQEGVESPCGPFVSLERDLKAAEARVAVLEKVLAECHTLSGRGGPPDDIEALNEIERISCAALSPTEPDGRGG